MLISIFLSIARLFSKLFYFSSLFSCFGVIVFQGVILSIKDDLPNYDSMLEYKPFRTVKIYDNSGQLIAETGKQNRIYVKYQDLPRKLISAFIAAEDRNFYSHSGIDLQSIARATIQTTFASILGKGVVGGSTITQQVVRIFLLSKEKTILRKAKEAFLAIKISRVLPKEKIIELYLNEIFLGQNSYGVAFASLTYFQKKLDELDINEIALLAALPKAPSTLNPFLNTKKTLSRRNWVLKKMLEEGYINNEEYTNYIKTNLGVRRSKNHLNIQNFYYVDTVEKEARKLIGDEMMDRGGVSINTYLDQKLQNLASTALRQGIERHDKKMGWRGPILSLSSTLGWDKHLSQMYLPGYLNPSVFKIGVLLEKVGKKLSIGIKDEGIRHITSKANDWVVNKLERGDVILLYKGENGELSVYQEPKLEGAIIITEPFTGKIFGMIGGYNYKRSSFNRAIQSKRQTGSVFKTFIYLAALESGYEPNFIISDSPISVVSDGVSKAWAPKNYGDDYMGDMTIRTALEKSRNIATVRLAMELGIKNLVEYIKKFGFVCGKDHANYSISLGVCEISPIDMTMAYNVFPSNGRRVQSRFIESIYDADGNVIYRDDFLLEENGAAPYANYVNDKILSDDVNFQIISMLEGVIKRGTGVRARVLGPGIAGKTGTTNSSYDSWFMGFSTNVTVGVFVGFDQPESLGQKEGGYSIALPIFIQFMNSINHKGAAQPFVMPRSLTPIYVNSITGEPVHFNDTKKTDSGEIILEFFKSQSVQPKRNRSENKSSDAIWDIVQSLN